MNRFVAILVILTCGCLASACRASEGPGEAGAGIGPEQGVSELVEAPELAPAATKAAPTATGQPPTATTAETATPGETMTEPTTSAADADVEFVRAVEAADGTWKFEVTVRHPDTGWEDYADGWDVVTDQDIVLKRNPEDTFTRLLLHPHETEQPFTRNQVGLVIPEGVAKVIVRAHDIVDGFGGKEVTVDLLTGSGPGFEVVRQ